MRRANLFSALLLAAGLAVPAAPVPPPAGARAGGDMSRYFLWPTTPEGQLQFLVDMANIVRKGPRGTGVFYHQLAAERSWTSFINLLEEVFGGHDH